MWKNGKYNGPLPSRQTALTIYIYLLLTDGGTACAVQHFCRLKDGRVHEAGRRVLEDTRKPREFVLATSKLQREAG